jgi:hypothetical protein
MKYAIRWYSHIWIHTCICLSPALTLAEDERIFGYKRELHMAYKIEEDINTVLYFEEVVSNLEDF